MGRFDPREAYSVAAGIKNMDNAGHDPYSENP